VFNSQSKTLLVGIGEEFRQDDAIGRLILRQLQSQLQGNEAIDTLELTGDCVNLIEAWQGYDRVFLFDATQTGQPPGSICRLDVHQQTLLADVFPSSTHLFGVAETIELARTLDRLPAQFIIYGIEGKQFSLGCDLTLVVKQAILEVVKMLMEELGSRM
jgi:hydrogenase maturation protease